MRKLLTIASLILCILFTNALISPVLAKPKNKELRKLYCESNDNYFQANEIIIKFKAKKANFADETKANDYISNKLDQSIKLRAISTANTERAKAKRLRRNLGIDRSYIVSLEDINSDPNFLSCNQLINTVKKLKRDPNISSVSPSYIFQTNSLTSDPLVTSTGQIWTFGKDELYGHKKINAPQAWDHAQGEGILVAVIDTGIDYNHPDLWNNIWVNPKLASDINQDGIINLDDVDINQNHRIDPEEIKPNLIGKNIAFGNDDPYDSLNGHGTHVSGSIAAVGNNNIGLAGVAYKAKILPIKAMDNDGYAPFSKLAEAIIYAADMGADVINNSWNCDCETPEIIRDAFEYSHNLDVVNVMSAGNLRKELAANTPAALNTTISVASTEFFDYRSYFSNYGSFVDIAAPGTSILSTLSQGAHETTIAGVRLGMDNNFDYWYISGTSMSAAMVSGAVAVIKSANPELNNEDIRRILKSHARQLDSFDQNLGAGLIDLEASVLEALSLRNKPIETRPAPTIPEPVQEKNAIDLEIEPVEDVQEPTTETPIVIKKASGEILISPANPQVNELIKIEFKANSESTIRQNYYWNIDSDDHIESRAQSFFAKYSQAGTETIELELIDTNGNSEKISKTIEISGTKKIDSKQNSPDNQASFLIRSTKNLFAKLKRNEILVTKFSVERTLSSLGKNLLLKVEVDPEYGDLVRMSSTNVKYIANNKNNFNIKLKLKSRRRFKTKLKFKFYTSNKLTIPVKITDLTNNYSVIQNLIVYI